MNCSLAQTMICSLQTADHNVSSSDWLKHCCREPNGNHLCAKKTQKHSINAKFGSGVFLMPGTESLQVILSSSLNSKLRDISLNLDFRANGVL